MLLLGASLRLCPLKQFRMCNAMHRIVVFRRAFHVSCAVGVVRCGGEWRRDGIDGGWSEMKRFRRPAETNGLAARLLPHSPSLLEKKCKFNPVEDLTTKIERSPSVAATSSSSCDRQSHVPRRRRRRREETPRRHHRSLKRSAGSSPHNLKIWRETNPKSPNKGAVLYLLDSQPC